MERTIRFTLMDYDALFSERLPAATQTPAASAAKAKYEFSVTYTCPHTLPYEGLCEAICQSIRRDGPELALYPPRQGHAGMREYIAERLKNNRGMDTTVDSVFLSGGANGAIQTILDAFIDPGDTVFVEEFTYLGTLNMLLSKRANVIHVPTDEQGMDVDALEDILKSLVARHERPKLIYTISVYQNPMGMTLSLERRRRMLEVSQKYGVPILENESYADFRIDGPSLPPAMTGMDDRGLVMYVSAYTKLLGCGMRLGYAVVPEPVRKALARLRFGGHPSHLAAWAVYEFMRNHGDEHVAKVVASLKDKRDAMLDSLAEHFPSTCTFTRPEGGMLVWGRMPEGADTWSALEKAVEAGVRYNPGPVFRAERDRKNFFRLTYSYNSPQEIRDGVAVLAEVFEREGVFDAA